MSKSKKASKSIRPVGQVTLDLENILYELMDDHELQLGEVLNLIRGWTEIHCQDAIEQYEDGSSPRFYYGPK